MKILFQLYETRQILMNINIIIIICIFMRFTIKNFIKSISNFVLFILSLFDISYYIRTKNVRIYFEKYTEKL